MKIIDAIYKLIQLKAVKSQVILLLLLLSNCVDSNYVRFESPQPDGIKELDSFNRKVKAEYISCFNADEKLIIMDNQIVNSRTFRLKCHKNDLEPDSTISLNVNDDDELKEAFKKDGFQVEIIGDTITANLITADTIFRITENQILKKFKGSYFLNYKMNENYWKVNRLEITSDSLYIGQITPSDTLLHFDFVVKNEEFNESDSSITPDYTMNPSRKEFKKLMKSKSFNETECYYRKK